MSLNESCEQTGYQMAQPIFGHTSSLFTENCSNLNPVTTTSEMYSSPTLPAETICSDCSYPSNAFGMNPNARPFRPSSQMCQQNVPPYVNEPMYDAYSASNLYYYERFGQQSPLQFIPYMNSVGNEEPDMNDITCENLYYMSANEISQPAPLTPDLFSRIMYSKNAALLQEVQVGLEQLMKEPDEFDTWSGAIRDRLLNETITTEGLSMAVEMILQMAITTQSVQYSFSRLCAFLCDEVENFRTKYFLPHLRLVHEDWRKDMRLEELRNLLLFFAEIYDKVKTVGGHPLNILEKAIFEQIKGLMNVNQINDDCVKTVVHVLKLSGRYFDSTDRGTALVDELLTQLNAFATGHPGISNSVKHQIFALTTLRKNKWGMRHQESMKALTSPETLTPSSSFDVLAGSYDPALNDEERAFLDEQVKSLDNGDAALDDSDIYDDYEDFLFKVDQKKATQRKDESNELPDVGSVTLNESEPPTQNGDSYVLVPPK